MNRPRRYSDDEVARIFEKASEDEATSVAHRPAGEGMTLAELQDIGREVGLSPDAVSRAAAALDPANRSVQKLVGLPVGVARVVELPRAFTDHEWERFVSDLRLTFRARGKVATEGGLRSWSNGNLHALVEPTDGGYRLRMGTRKGDVGARLVMGSAMLVWGVILAITALLGGNPGALGLAAALILFGGVFGGVSTLRLSGWAAERREQMDSMADRALALTAGEPENT